MAIHYFTEQVAKPCLKYRFISKWLKSIIVQQSKKSGNISYIFCGDGYLLDLNTRFLNHDYYTDIITFDYTDENNLSGDIYISVDRVYDNSIRYGVNLEDEFLRVMAHGILHLLNYEDQNEDEKKFMRKLESDHISLYKQIEHDGSFKI